MVRVFIGYDPRQPVAYTVLQHSIIKRASVPVQITPLILKTLPIDRTGLTEFTFSRYLVPYLCGYEGTAIFMDSDMLVLGDVAKLMDAAFDPSQLDYAVYVSKNIRKFEWPSMMVFNNTMCQKLTPEYIDTGNPFSFEWANGVGELPPEWNHLVGYDKKRDDAKLVHYTQGIPAYPECQGCEYTEEWIADAKECLSHQGWKKIMGNSVHTGFINGEQVPKFIIRDMLEQSGNFTGEQIEQAMNQTPNLQVEHETQSES